MFITKAPGVNFIKLSYFRNTGKFYGNTEEFECYNTNSLEKVPTLRGKIVEFNLSFFRKKWENFSFYGITEI